MPFWLSIKLFFGKFFLSISPLLATVITKLLSGNASLVGILSVLLPPNSLAVIKRPLPTFSKVVSVNPLRIASLSLINSSLFLAKLSSLVATLSGLI